MLGNRIFQKRMIFIVLVLFVFSICLAPMAFGQDEAPKVKKTQSLWDIIKAGGAIGFVIILLSFVGFALVIEHFLTIKRDALVPPDLLAHIEQLFDDEEYEEVMALCEAQPTFLTNVIAATLPRIGTSFDYLIQSIGDAVADESMKLFQKIGYIQLISSLAPMLGLLGTVTGMIAAFQVIASSEGSPSPSELADSIGMALVTTAEGLVVAIPLTAFYFFFRNKIVRISSEVQAISEELMDRFRDLG
ncbi:MAG: MotA/TolQ/ExbB proton channel family protein [Planctomycetota bacterium]|nr:MAG: MotA/TolQ/ExbB proton channel family protein [Planctomycetota bacterium]